MTNKKKSTKRKIQMGILEKVDNTFKKKYFMPAQQFSYKASCSTKI